MLAEVVRSGLVESRHRGAVVAVDSSGKVVGRWGGEDAPFFLRSAAKPFQAVAALEAGATLSAEELAVACASHAGEPVHLALVRRILSRSGLGPEALQCAADVPLGAAAARRVAAGGDLVKRPIYHNCSGKHATMVAACVARGWPVATYLETDHPLQQAIAGTLAAATGEDLNPVGVDGCGAPTYGTTVTGLAHAYSRLGGDDRFAAAFAAMRRFPLLVSGSGRSDGMLAIASGGAAKIGAQGCLGVALPGGLGVAAKVEDGAAAPAVVAVVAALRDLGLVAGTAEHGYAAAAAEPVLGGGSPVGALQAVRTDADT